MGWGTFIAGQAVSYIRRSGRRKSNFNDDLEEYIGAIQKMSDAYQSDFCKRVSSKAVLAHPDVANVVDEDLWKKRLWNRGGWFFAGNLLAWPALWWALRSINDPFQWEFGFLQVVTVFALVPLFWIVPKEIFVATYVGVVNRSFSKRGFDVARMKKQMASVVDRALRATRDNQIATAQRLKRQKDEAKKRLYGQDSS